MHLSRKLLPQKLPDWTSPTKFTYHIDSGGGNNVNSNNRIELLIGYFNSLQT